MRRVKIYFDYSELSLGDSWREQLAPSLLRAKLLLAIITPAFFESEWCELEWATFQAKEAASDSKSPLILPIMIRGRDMAPGWVRNRQWFDMSDSPLQASAFTDKRQSLKLTEQIQKLAKQIAQLLQDAPPFDSKWTLSQKPPR